MPESLASPRLWLAFAIMLGVSGIANAFPVFFPPLLAEFGGSRAATAFTVTLLWVGGAVLGPFAGHLVDRRSPRVLVAVGLAATALGLGAGAAAPTLPAFIAAVGIGGGIGVGLTGMVTHAAVIADAFVRHRGFATGIAFAGSMGGYVLAGPVQRTITAFGWRATLVGWAVALLALVPLVLAIYPARLAPRVAGAAAPVAGARRVRDIVATPAFWALAVVFTVAPAVGYLATVQHAVYFASLGFSPDEAAAMLVVGGVLSTSGRALSGLAADRFGASVAGFVSYSLSLLGVLCLVTLEFHPARWLAWGYVLFVFLPLGTRATIVSILVSRIAVAGNYGAVFGLLAIGNSAGAAAGPFLSGALYDLTRSYLAIYLTAVAMLAGALAALAVFVRTTGAARRAAAAEIVHPAPPAPP